jgi:hypothetical protein
MPMPRPRQSGSSTFSPIGIFRSHIPTSPNHQPRTWHATVAISKSTWIGIANYTYFSVEIIDYTSRKLHV